jgi:hypothetical protein
VDIVSKSSLFIGGASDTSDETESGDDDSMEFSSELLCSLLELADVSKVFLRLHDVVLSIFEIELLLEFDALKKRTIVIEF